MLSNLSRWLAHEVVKITDQCEKISEISLIDKVRLFYDQKYAHSMNKRSLECVTAVVIYSYYHIELSVTTGYFGPRCHFSLYTGFCKSPEEVGVQLNLAWKSRAFVLFYRTAFFWFVSWFWWLAQNLASWFHPINCDLLERVFPALDAGCIRWSLFALWLVRSIFNVSCDSLITELKEKETELNISFSVLIFCILVSNMKRNNLEALSWRLWRVAFRNLLSCVAGEFWDCLSRHSMGWSCLEIFLDQWVCGNVYS